MTHSFILRKEEPPVCVACNTRSTIKDLLIECDDLVEVRKKYFDERSSYSLLRNVNPKKKRLPEIDWYVLYSMTCVEFFCLFVCFVFLAG